MNCLALLDAGFGNFVIFMGLPFLLVFIALAAVVITKTVEIIRDAIFDSKNNNKEENKDNEQS
jgi:hypothetical protein